MAKLTGSIHSIDRLDHPFGIYITPYIFVEDDPSDLTLIDTCFMAELPKLIDHFRDEGFDVKNVKRLESLKEEGIQYSLSYRWHAQEHFP